MFNKFVPVAITALALVPMGVVAAPIDLLALGLEESTPEYTGSGTVVYDFGEIFDGNDLVIDGYPDGFAAFGFLGSPGDTFTMVYDFGNASFFDIVQIGDNGGDTLEFLLSLDSEDLTDSDLSLGDNAIVRMVSDGFDFAQSDPLTYFDSQGDGAEYGISFTVTALSDIAPIPLPAGILLLGTGLAGLGVMHRRRKVVTCS